MLRRTKYLEFFSIHVDESQGYYTRRIKKEVIRDVWSMNYKMDEMIQLYKDL